MIVSPDFTNLQSVRNQLISSGQNSSSSVAVQGEANHGFFRQIAAGCLKIGQLQERFDNSFKMARQTIRHLIILSGLGFNH
jgi:hypothetical protein